MNGRKTNVRLRIVWGLIFLLLSVLCALLIFIAISFLRNLDEETHTASFGGFTWSPDGNRVAFVVSSQYLPPDLYVMDVDNPIPVKLTNSEATELFPAWSPDGNQIAFISDRDGSDQIYVMNADGSHARRLTNVENRLEWCAWSPDGEKIVFVPDSDHFGNGIFVVDVSTANVTKLTDQRVNFRSAMWSPNGRRIAFTAHVEGEIYHDLYVMDADGSRLRSVATPEFSGVDWASDSTTIAYRDQQGFISVVNLETGTTKVLFNNAPNVDAFWYSGNELRTLQIVGSRLDGEFRFETIQITG